MQKLEDIVRRLNEFHSYKEAVPSAVARWVAMPVQLTEWLVQAAYDRTIAIDCLDPKEYATWSPWIVWDVCATVAPQCHTFVALGRGLAPTLMGVSLQKIVWDVKGIDGHADADKLACALKAMGTALCRRWGIRDPSYELAQGHVTNLTNKLQAWVKPTDRSPVLVFCNDINGM
jgi:hypothetical protein